MSPLALTLILLPGLFAVLLDLGVLDRKARAMTLSAALGWSTFWLAVALVFTGLVYLMYERGFDATAGGAAGELGGQQAALQFFSGYVIERSITLANILVMAMIFGRLRVPLLEQHRVLFWGMVALAAFRVIAVGAGSVLVFRFDWLANVFGVLLIVSALRVFVARQERIVPERNLAVFVLRRRYTEIPEAASERFFVQAEGRWGTTPLLTALLLIVTVNAMFALDAVPGILTVTREPFLILTANLFALAGLRAMYFALAGFVERLRYLRISLAVLMGYVGVRLLLRVPYPIDEADSLAVMGIILGSGVALSMALGRRIAPGLSPMIEGIEEIVWISYRQARRLVVLLIGVTVMLAGVVMIVAPGPAFIMIPLGLGILAIEFAWARRWLSRVRERLGEVEGRIAKQIGRPPRQGSSSRPDDAGEGDG